MPPADDRRSLNIPSGNSEVLAADFEPVAPLTGDNERDFWNAVQQIDVKKDLANIGEIPCARQSLLFGIGGGVGLGAVHFLTARKPKAAANWAVGSFVAIALFQMQVCSRARSRELQQMRMIQEKFPHRHVSTLKKKADSPDSSQHAFHNV